MLTFLSIRNIATIEKLEAQFSGSLNVITGETGAGKSVLLESLQLLTGSRAEINYIRPNCDTAEISAQFEIAHYLQVKKWLEEREWDTEDNILHIRRIISRNGRSKVFIQGQLASIQELKALGFLLISVNSQFAFQALTKTESHINLLDQFANTLTLSKKVKTLYHEHELLQKSIKTIKADQQQKQDRLALLTYQIEELKNTAISAEEIEALENKQACLSQAHKLKQTASEVKYHLQENTSQNILQLLSKHTVKLNPLSHLSPKLHNANQLIQSAIIQIEEACTELDLISSDSEEKQEELSQIETKLNLVYLAARKYKIKPQNLFEHKINLEKEYQLLSPSQKTLEQLENKLKNSTSDYNDAAQILSQKRQDACPEFIKAATETIRLLGMPHAQFNVEQDTDTQRIPTEKGIDDIHFLISTNPGIPIQPLQKIASGGELSRICLAIYTIISNKSGKNMESKTLVFDEMDTGISGSIAEMVGHLLKKLGKQFQVLCVTHLPQVAAQANTHFRLSKEVANELTYTKIEQVENNEKVNEIARLLAGIQVTELSRAQAKEMLDLAEQD